MIKIGTSQRYWLKRTANLLLFFGLKVYFLVISLVLNVFYKYMSDTQFGNFFVLIVLIFFISLFFSRKIKRWMYVIIDSGLIALPLIEVVTTVRSFIAGKNTPEMVFKVLVVFVIFIALTILLVRSSFIITREVKSREENGFSD